MTCVASSALVFYAQYDYEVILSSNQRLDAKGKNYPSKEMWHCPNWKHHRRCSLGHCCGRCFSEVAQALEEFHTIVNSAFAS